MVKTGEEFDEESVIGHCAGAMALFEIPKRVLFIDSRLKTPSGKQLKREALRRRRNAGQGDPEEFWDMRLIDLTASWLLAAEGFAAK